jgi:poly-beta-1,6-N-acetyl-D-glucosamine biosynthesis protein PgaD
MGKSGSGNRNQAMIIDGSKLSVRKAIELIITLLAWIYMIATVLLLFTCLFHIQAEWKLMVLLLFHMEERQITAILCDIGIIGALCFLFQYLWGRYNYFTYGKLRRRSFPKPVEMKEMAEYFSLTEEEILYLQETNIIKLKETVV